MKIRTGIGYDVHKLEDGKPFWLGGIRIEHNKGTVGHSDADVLIHTVCDALLGAANLRDIGYHFADTDPEYKGIDSKILLQRVAEMLNDQGWRISNIDAVVCLQKPKISQLIPEMQRTMADILNIDNSDLSLKATTSEKLGFVGKEEGVSAMATALIIKDD